MYAVDVQIIHVTSDNYTLTRQVPTFFIDENVQGIGSILGIERTAIKIVDPIGYLDDAHDTIVVTAVKLSDLQWERYAEEELAARESAHESYLDSIVGGTY